MTPPYLIVRRFPYEEPHLTELEFRASNGSFSGAIDFFCGVEDLAEIGAALKVFPSKAQDEFVYEYGSDDPDNRDYRRFRLRIYAVDHAGHCAVQFYADVREKTPNEGVCTFSIRAEPAALHRLGQLFENFHKLEHLELQWSPSGGALFTEHQAEFWRAN